ncbi:MAG: twin-arginine translocation signal domain-containing protein [Gammaproteobacteria bacterium]
MNRREFLKMLAVVPVAAAVLPRISKTASMPPADTFVEAMNGVEQVHVALLFEGEEIEYMGHRLTRNGRAYWVEFPAPLKINGYRVFVPSDIRANYNSFFGAKIVPPYLDTSIDVLLGNGGALELKWDGSPLEIKF